MYINDISVGGNNQVSKAVTVTSNGTTSITPDSGYDALEKVDLTINVSGVDISPYSKVICGTYTNRASMTLPSGYKMGAILAGVAGHSTEARSAIASAATFISGSTYTDASADTIMKAGTYWYAIFLKD